MNCMTIINWSMIMDVDNLMIDPGAAIYYDHDFRNTLESFLTYLRNTSSTITNNVLPNDAVKFEFDLFSLLNTWNIPAYMHHLIMRVNNMDSPFDMNKNITSLMIPSITTVEYIRQSYMSTSIIG